MFNSTESTEDVSLSLTVSLEIRRHSTQLPWTYSALDQRQREIADQVRAGHAGTLLVSEVAPIVTRGRRTPESDVAEDHLASRFGIPVYSTDRGGFATYHGPGQWVLFPVDRLERLTGDRLGVKKTVEALLEIACQVGRLYEPKVTIRKGNELGVWTPRGKFAAVGVHVSQGVLLHGLSVNGFRTPTSFVGLRPCGLDSPVDFLLPEASDLEFEKLKDSLISTTLKTLWH